MKHQKHLAVFINLFIESFKDMFRTTEVSYQTY